MPGVSPGRWVDTWRERYRRHPIEVREIPAAEVEAHLLAGAVDVAFLRLPLTSALLARIPLWHEETVVVLSREDELTLLDAVSLADLADSTVIVPADDVLGLNPLPGRPFAGPRPANTSEALELVARQAGVCVLPRSLALLLRRRDMVVRPLIDHDGAVPTSQIGLAWVPVDGQAPPLVADFIGVVRGRTPNSTRGR